MLECESCKKELSKGRICRECMLESKRIAARERYRKYKKRTLYTHICEACAKGFTTTRKTSSGLCEDCRKSLKKEYKATNNYKNSGGSGYCWEHRRIAEEVLGRKLSSNEVVHHMDENPMNNDIKNLIIISRSQHGKLHMYLDKQRVIIEKSMSDNSENCWDNLRVPMTTTWLETASVKVIKLWEIGQSAAELLRSNEYEEGSETI
jgi:hypothetical protein